MISVSLIPAVALEMEWDTVAKENATQRFMRATGKLRAIFGPANRSSLGHDMTEG